MDAYGAACSGVSRTARSGLRGNILVKKKIAFLLNRLRLLHVDLYSYRRILTYINS